MKIPEQALLPHSISCQTCMKYKVDALLGMDSSFVFSSFHIAMEGETCLEMGSPMWKFYHLLLSSAGMLGNEDDVYNRDTWRGRKAR